MKDTAYTLNLVFANRKTIIKLLLYVLHPSTCVPISSSRYVNEANKYSER